MKRGIKCQTTDCTKRAVLWVYNVEAGWSGRHCKKHALQVVKDKVPQALKGIGMIVVHKMGGD